MSELEIKALKMWAARELSFPKFTRRMRPTRWDLLTGSWHLMLKQAEESR